MNDESNSSPEQMYGEVAAAQPLHEQLVDMMLMEPHLEQTQIAVRLGHSVTFIRKVMQSDLFQAYYTARRDQVNAIIGQELAGQAQRLAGKGLKELNTRFSDPAKLENMGTKEVREVTKMAMTFGTDPLRKLAKNDGGATPVNVNISVMSEALARARQRMKEVNERNTDRHQAEYGGMTIDIKPSVD